MRAPERYAHWAIAKVSRTFRRPLTLASLLGYLLTSACFLVVALSPAIKASTAAGKPQPFWSWDTWKAAFAVSWFAVLAAAYLKISEAYKRIKHKNNISRDRYVSRKVVSVRAIRELGTVLSSATLDPKETQPLREHVLASAASVVGDVLDLSDEERVCVTLLDFDEDIKHMKVVARSSPDREVGKVYESEVLVAWNAIRNGDAVVADDIKNDSRWEKLGRRPYRSVMAIPIVRSGRAYGGLSIDSKDAYRFVGRRDEIVTALMPYIEILALTYRTNGVCCDCEYNLLYAPVK